MDEQEPIHGSSQGWHFHRRRTDDLGNENGPRDEDREHSEHDRRKDNKKDTDDKSKEDKDDKDDKKDEQEKMSPQKKRLLIVIAIIIALILVIGGLSYYLHARHYEDTDDAFIDGHISQISPQVSGQIITLPIRDNQQVEKGQLLAQIDARDYQARLAQAQAQLAQAQAQVALQEADVAQAEANVVVSEAQAFQANRDMARFTTIDVKAITREQRDNAISNAKAANARLLASRKSVEAAQAQVGVAKASVKQADAQVKNAELQLSYTQITSPITGKVTRRTVEIGNIVSPGMPLMAIASNELWVTANLKETQLNYMRIGQAVRIKVDAFPNAIFSGHVDSFQKGTGAVFSTLPAENATGNYVKVVQRVPVKIVFDNTRERDRYPLTFGMSVVPRVKVR